MPPSKNTYVSLEDKFPMLYVAYVNTNSKYRIFLNQHTAYLNNNKYNKDFKTAISMVQWYNDKLCAFYPQYYSIPHSKSINYGTLQQLLTSVNPNSDKGTFKANIEALKQALVHQEDTANQQPNQIESNNHQSLQRVEPLQNQNNVINQQNNFNNNNTNDHTEKLDQVWAMMKDIHEVQMRNRSNNDNTDENVESENDNQQLSMQPSNEQYMEAERYRELFEQKMEENKKLKKEIKKNKKRLEKVDRIQHKLDNLQKAHSKMKISNNKQKKENTKLKNEIVKKDEIIIDREELLAKKDIKFKRKNKKKPKTNVGKKQQNRRFKRIDNMKDELLGGSISSQQDYAKHDAKRNPANATAIIDANEKKIGKRFDDQANYEHKQDTKAHEESFILICRSGRSINRELEAMRQRKYETGKPKPDPKNSML